MQGDKLLHRRQVNMEHLPIERHLPHIRTHVAETGLGHALPDQRLLFLGHHDMKMDGAAAFLPVHSLSVAALVGRVPAGDSLAPVLLHQLLGRFHLLGNGEHRLIPAQAGIVGGGPELIVRRLLIR